MGKEIYAENKAAVLTPADALDIQYTLSFPAPHTHYVEVEMVIDGIKQDVTEIKLPVWTPGSYLVREFAKNVVSFEAYSGNKKLDVRKKRKNIWAVPTKDVGKVTVRYTVYAYEMTVRTSFVDADRAYLNGTSIFMYVGGFIQNDVKVVVEPHGDWKEISTGLPKTKDKWVRTAPNYDVLADSPLLIGNQEILTFTAEGIPHYIAIDGESNCDNEQMVKDFIKITEVETALFEEHPCEEYTYIILNTEKSYGGLEHLNSTSLIFPRWSYKPKDKYLRFVSLAAHEYFHLWNVKRIRPMALGPFDYDNENYTHLLWVMEGFTSYYDEYLLRRADFIDDKTYLGMVVKNFNYCENTPGADVQSLTEASFDAWIKYYRQNENSSNCAISYYSKGAAVSILLDLEIRYASGDKNSLDDVLRYLYQEFYKKQNRGFTDDEIQAVCEQFAGKSLEDFFTNYIWGTTPLDYDKYLGYVGLQTMDRLSDSSSPYLGTNTKTENGRLLITKVVIDSPAWNSGLNVNDEIVAIDGFRVTEKLGDWMAKYGVGETVTLTITREGKLKTMNVTLTKNPRVDLTIVKRDDATPKQKKRYKDWLGAEF